MEERQLGKDGPTLTTIGFGTWAIGGAWRFGWGKQDEQAAIAAIQRALELGINWIDTAAVYGLGRSEELVRQALQGNTHEVFIATKCGMVWDQRGRVKNNLRPESIQMEVEDSLRRLGVEVIDLYQIHWPDPGTPWRESWEKMADLQKQGKVRWIGVSNFRVELLENCRTIAPVQSLQPPYSIIQKNYEAEELPYCRQNGIGVVVYSPMQSGILTGKFEPQRLAPDDWRRNSPQHTEPTLSKNLQLVARLKPIAAEYGKTVGQFAVAWTLMNPAVTAAIVGARSPQQVEENVGGADWRIKPADMEQVNSLVKEVLD